MEVSKMIEVARIEELKIISNARIILKSDLNPIESKENLSVQIDLSGELKGSITCYLCLDNTDLSHADKNFIYPLFIESMNILIGKQLSLDDEFNGLIFKITPPKISLNPTHIRTNLKRSVHKYELILNETPFTVLADYSLQIVS